MTRDVQSFHHKLVFTHHAVDRYQKRHAPHLTSVEARAELEGAAERAVRLKEKSVNGDSLWRIEELGIEVAVKHDRVTRSEVAVTVLPMKQPDYNDFEEE